MASSVRRAVKRALDGSPETLREAPRGPRRTPRAAKVKAVPKPRERAKPRVAKWDPDFAELLPEAVIVRCEGKIVAINSAGVRQYGASSAAELIGRDSRDFVHPDDRAKLEAPTQRVLDGTGRTEFLPVRRLRVDGSVYPGEIVAVPCRWKGKPASMVFVRDVTARARAEEELLKTQRLLDDAVESMENGLAVFDEDERFVFANGKFLAGDPARADLTPGITFEDFITRTLTRHRDVQGLRQDGALREQVRWRVERFRKGTDSAEFRDGFGRWFLATNQRTKSGATVLINTEITRQKRIELEQRETAERLRHLIETSPYGVYVHTKGVIRLANAATVRLFGAATADELIGRHALDFVHPDDMPAARVFADKQMPIARNGEPIEQKRVRLDGSVYWGEISSTRITWDGEDSFLVFLRDVTDRVSARAELEKTRERLDDAIESMPNGFALFDEHGRFVFANDKFVSGDPAVEEYLKPGTTYEAFIAQTLTKNRAFHGLEDDAALEAAIRRAIDQFREASAEHEFKDGVGRWFLSSTRRTESGATVVTNTEITERKRIEQQIKDHAEQLRLLLEHAPYAILVQTKGVYRLANPAALRMFGARTADELIGRRVLDLVHPDDRATVAGRLQRLQGVAPGGEPVEDRRLRLDGTPFWAQVTASPIDWNGERGGLIFFNDVTRRRKLREAYEHQQEVLRQAVESIGQGLWIFDADLKLVVWNTRLAEKMQYPPELLHVGASFADIMRFAIARGDFGPGDPEALLADRLATTKAEKPFGFERAAPGGRTIEVRFSPMPGGGFVTTMTDITERKSYEDALAALNDRLLEQTRELKRSNEDLEQFAYVASHDLQEPLRSVASYCQLLQRRYKGKLDEDADTFIGFAVEGAQRMQRLINDLLKYSRVGTRGKPFEPTDCNQVFAEACANLRQAIAEANAKVSANDLPTLQGDAVQLGQLFQNVIGNAIKFRGDRPVEVRVDVEMSNGEEVISVRDNGIGIEERHRERIFQIFQRLHERDKYPGTGIGLAVCKKIVERHGGRIWVESEPGQGSAFRFTLAPKSGAPREQQ